MHDDKDTKAGETHAPWQREFFKNIEAFIRYGVPEEEAKRRLYTFLKLSVETPLPAVMDTFKDPTALERVGVHTRQNPELRDFVVSFLDPLMTNFTFEGEENLKYILPLAGKFPVVLISNHISHLDAPAIYHLLYRQGGEARKVADQLAFIAGRLAFEEDFGRLGLYMFDTLLVCSKRDMTQNPGLADTMTRINMRAFRQSQSLQKEGKVLAIFPEGTRSRTGSLLGFVDTVYHYVANKIIIPVSLEGTDQILPADSFLFQQARGKMSLGRPVLVGELSKKLMAELPDYVDRLPVPEEGDKKQFIIDNLAALVGRQLHRHRHGTYRNLYRGLDPTEENTLIRMPAQPQENILVVGHSPAATAIACVLANQNVTVSIYVLEDELAAECNEMRVDRTHFPLFKLPPNIQFTTNPQTAEKATMVFQCVRPWELDRYYSRLKLYLAKNDAPIISAVKGFTGSPRGLILDDLAADYDLDPVRFFAMSGANYPQQIMERKITGYEIAAVSRLDRIEYLTKLCSNAYIFARPAVVPSDVKGVQLGGALKNIYALATGLLDGYYEKNLGGNNDNSLFHVSNRFYREMTAIGTALGGKPETFSGLSGLTDLMLACFGQESKDRQYGHDLVYGKADPSHKSSGLFGIRSLPNLIDFKPEKYPVAWAVHAILVEGRSGEEVLDKIVYNLRRV